MCPTSDGAFLPLGGEKIERRMAITVTKGNSGSISEELLPSIPGYPPGQGRGRRALEGGEEPTTLTQGKKDLMVFLVITASEGREDPQANGVVFCGGRKEKNILST